MAKKNTSNTKAAKTTTQQATDETQKTEAPAAETTTTETGETNTPVAGESTQEETKAPAEQTGAGETEIAGGETSPEKGDDTQVSAETTTPDAGTGGDKEDDDGDAGGEVKEDNDGDIGGGDDEDKVDEEPTTYAAALMGAAPEGLGSIGYKLGGYLDAMQPNLAQDEGSIQKNQLRLRGVINNVLDLGDDRFGAGMKFLVGVVRAHRKTVFAETMVFRGFDRLKASRSERQKLETLTSLLLATADIKNPKDVAKSVDLAVVYRFVSDNDQQQKLQSYYGG